MGPWLGRWSGLRVEGDGLWAAYFGFARRYVINYVPFGRVGLPENPVSLQTLAKTESAFPRMYQRGGGRTSSQRLLPSGPSWKPTLACAHMARLPASSQEEGHFMVLVVLVFNLSSEHRQPPLWEGHF